MKNKKKNKAQRQAGRRLCKNIKNGRNTSCGFINHKKETPIYASNMRVYISNASGQFTMDQHIDTTKLERELGYKPGVMLREGVDRFVAWYLSDENPLR